MAQTDGNAVKLAKWLLTLMLFGGAALAQFTPTPLLCNVGNGTPCSSVSNTGNGSSGQPLWQMFGIVNNNFNTLAKFWPQTAAESAAGVTPTNYLYPPGNVLRYGADATGSADSTTAIQNAINVAEVQQSITGPSATVYIPVGTFLVSSTLRVNTSNVRIRGAGRTESRIRCNTSGMGDVIFVNNGSNWVFDVYLKDFFVFVESGLSSPPNGLDLKNTSNSTIESVAISNAADGIIINGDDIDRINDIEVNGGGSTSTSGIHFETNGTIYNVNYFTWIENADVFNVSTAGILIGSAATDLQIRASYIEEAPHGILVSNDSGNTQVLVDGLKASGLAVWNVSPDTYTGTDYFAAIAPSGSGSYLQVRNSSIDGAYSYQGNSSSYHVQFLQNGNTNAATTFQNNKIDGGNWYSASTALVNCTATNVCTGGFGAGINALNGFRTGSAISLQTGSGAAMASFTLTDSSATCSMSSGTSCTATVPTGSAHCAAYAQGSTAYYAACSVSGTTATVTANASNSATWLVQATQ
jgi:hypothetical protein